MVPNQGQIWGRSPHCGTGVLARPFAVAGHRRERFLSGSVKIKRNRRGRPFYILIVAAKVYPIRISSAMARRFFQLRWATGFHKSAVGDFKKTCKEYVTGVDRDTFCYPRPRMGLASRQEKKRRTKFGALQMVQ
jgi:hypothetical protein